MKRLFMMMPVAVMVLAVPAMAQMLGLPVADDATAKPQGLMRASGGIVLGDHVNLYGGRLTFGLMPEVALFGGLGIVDPDHGDSGWGIQGGGLAALPFGDLPFQLAVRGTLGYASLDQEYRVYDWDPLVGHTSRRQKFDLDIVSMNIGALASKKIDLFTLYGYLGFCYARYDASGHTDSETDPALGGGVIFPLNPQFALYAELMHIDKAWFGFGGQFEF